LQALLANTVLPAEIVVVDQSREPLTLAEFQLPQRDSRAISLSYVRQLQRGLSASRNEALTRATQPVIAFTDDDCIPDREWVATIARVLGAPGAPHAVTGRVLAWGSASPDTYPISQRLSQQRIQYTGRTAPWVIGTGNNIAARCDWLRRIGAFDERLGAGTPGRAAEDTDLIYRLTEAGACIQYEPDLVVYHERQSRSRRLATRRGYGHGIGAFTMFGLRRGDLHCAYLLGLWSLSGMQALLNAVARRDWFDAHGRLLNIVGTLEGCWYGLLVP